MRRILVMVVFLLSIPMILGFPVPAHGFQAPAVWVDANGNAHSSPPEAPPAAGTVEAAPPYASLSGTPPASGSGVTTPEAAGTAPANSYLLWQDPGEGAFSVSLPMGWRISGGTVRSTKFEAHYLVRAQSPDGGAKLFMDDPGILMREVPNQGTEAMGVKIGQELPSGLGSSLIVEPYRPGDQFAAEYVKQILCPSATMILGGPIADQTQALNAQFGPLGQLGGKALRADAGELAFKCGARTGYVYVITVQAMQPDGPVAIWAVYRIAGYLASPADSPAAAAAVNQMLGTFHMNQTWLQSYAKESGDTAGIVVRESNAVTQTTIDREKAIDAEIQASIESSRHNSASIPNGAAGATSSASSTNANGHNNAQVPTKNVCDDLGRCQTVDAGIANWWSDCSGIFYPGPESGGPPPASQSACWSKGR